LGRCPNLTKGGRCPSCLVEKWRDDPKTDAAQRRIYDSPRWRGLRRTVHAETDFCAVPGCNRAWTHLDHIVPLREILEAGGDPYARSIVQPLCKPHHSRKTMAEIRQRSRSG